MYLSLQEVKLSEVQWHSAQLVLWVLANHKCLAHPQTRAAENKCPVQGQSKGGLEIKADHWALSEVIVIIWSI